VGCVGLGVGLCPALAHTERTREGINMDAIENIALMALLMVAGVGISVAVLIGFLYYMEVQDDR
jgi:hypothetical protein